MAATAITPIVYLNGQFLPQDEAKISVMDRGFLLGDGVYEVLPAFNGKLFRGAEHLERLAQSLAKIHLPNPFSAAQWEDLLLELVQRNPGTQQSLYLQITRGIAPIRDHVPPADIKPTIFAMSSPIKPLPDSTYQQGVAAITVTDIRWQHCDIKAISLLANVLARMEAAQQQAVEAILVRPEGLVTEGAASTLFIVQHGILKTPPNSDLILPGITRDLILELATELSIPTAETNLQLADLTTCEEIWLSSSIKEILPVTQLNHQPVGTGRPGPYWQRLQQRYQTYKQQY